MRTSIESRVAAIERRLDRALSNRMLMLEMKIDAITHRLVELEAEDYDASKVKSAIKEIREHLQDNSDFWSYVKLEESQ
jgi:SUMO ligase MMS21 Smc5/6 complex component